MKKTKIFSLALAAVMTASLLAGCGSSKDTEETTKETEATKETVAEETTAEKVEKVTFPKEITLNVTTKVGGSLDVRARVIADYLAKELNTSIVINNNPGAGGITCATAMLTAPETDYDLMVSGIGTFTSSPLFNETVYKISDFTPIAAIDSEDFGLFVCPAQSGIKTFEDLVNYGKTNTIIYGSGGTGNTTHIYQAGLYNSLGLKAETLAHSSAVEGITNCMGGHNVVTMAGIEVARSYVESGDIVPIMTFSKDAYTGYEGFTVPSILEVGTSAEVPYASRYLVSCLSKADDAHKEALKDALAKVLSDPDCIKDLEAVGVKQLSTDKADDLPAIVENEANAIKKILDRIGSAQ